MSILFRPAVYKEREVKSSRHLGTGQERRRIFTVRSRIGKQKGADCPYGLGSERSSFVPHSVSSSLEYSPDA
jgi:hypothetical protein